MSVTHCFDSHYHAYIIEHTSKVQCVPGTLGRSQDHPGMDTAPPPPCMSILGFLGYPDDHRIIPGWTQLYSPLSEYPGISGIPGRSQDHPRMDTAPLPPCLSILGFLGYPDDLRIIPGWTQLYPPYLSILGFPGYSDDHRIIPGWTYM